MRSIEELLKLVLKRSPKWWQYRKASHNGGLCSIVRELVCSNIITWNEEYDLLDYIRDHRPQYPPITPYGWKPYYWSPRRKFLRKHIKLNKS